MKYGKLSSKKKRKPLYENTSKNLEYNNQKKLKKAMDSYLNDYKRMSKKLGIKNPEEIIFSETDIEDSIYNIDLMVNKWGDFYDLTPSYNPQIEEYSLYNHTNIIFQSKNPIIKKDYNLRIQKIYPSKEQNNEQYNLKSVKKNIKESIKKNDNEKKEEENIIGEEEEYKFDDNDKNYNEEEEYKFDDNDKNYNEENNNNNIEEEYYFEDEEVDKKDGPKLNKKEEEIFYYEDEEIDNKDGPKLNYNNNYDNNNNDEIEENIEGKKLPELNDLIKEDSVKLPQLNDILKSDNKDNIQVISNKKKINNEKNEEIEDEIIEEEIPNQKKEKIEKNKKNEINEIKKSNTTNLKENVEIKKSNTSNLNKENLINSEIKKSKTSNLNNYNNKLKKENKKKENNFNPNETIYETMQRVDKKTKIITKALNKNLIQNLNKRQKICSDWDSNYKNLIFIYIEKINNNKKDVESLLVRIYSLKKKKTNYKIISIRLLHHMGVFNSDKIDRIKIKNYSKEIFKAVEKIISNK